MIVKAKTYLYLVILVLGVCTVFSCGESDASSNEAKEGETLGVVPDVVDFSLHVKPILSDRCFVCHGPDKNAVEGGLSLHTAEGAYEALGKDKDHFAIVPGDTKKSELVKRIYSNSAQEMMPPPESNLSLTATEKAILSKWVEQGAEYKEHWAFIPPEMPAFPEQASPEGETPIDRFIIAKLDEKGMSSSAQAPPEKLLRRVHFDLCGLPPSPSEVIAFEDRPTALHLEKIIDSLLQTTDHAELMAADWMDVARYADTHGYQDDFERTMWPWRDWVIHAFQKNMPYDEFVTMQLAGDLMPNPTLEHILATGFNRNHKITAEGGVIPEEYRVEYVEDRLQTFGTAFMGLTVECARCHDHKYDPISQKNHFELFSFFNNVPERGLIDNAADIPEPYITISQKEVDEVLSFVNLKAAESSAVPVMVMDEMEVPRQAFVLGRGAYDQPEEEVFPATPASILDFPEAYPKNRLGLAKWLFNPQNPMTARVTVNRVWQRLFGHGIVKSSYDFGNQGSLPTHPELLDYLACRLVELKWDMNALTKEIMLTAVYQRSTVTSAEVREKDPDNHYLARAPRIRLSGELIRDQALAISGLLEKEVGGPSVKPYQPSGIWEETTGGGGGSTSKYVQGEGADLYRKSMYTFWKRTVPPPSMLTFDASSRDLCTVKRQETNTPLQALVLLNDPQLIEAARCLAYQEYVVDSSTKLKIGNMFLKATSRKPNENELNSLLAFYDTMLTEIQSGEVVPDAYLKIGEHQVPANAMNENLTALALTAHTILNLDETINR